MAPWREGWKSVNQIQASWNSASQNLIFQFASSSLPTRMRLASGPTWVKRIGKRHFVNCLHRIGSSLRIAIAMKKVSTCLWATSFLWRKGARPPQMQSQNQSGQSYMLEAHNLYLHNSSPLPFSMLPWGTCTATRR